MFTSFFFISCEKDAEDVRIPSIKIDDYNAISANLNIPNGKLIKGELVNNISDTSTIIISSLFEVYKTYPGGKVSFEIEFNNTKEIIGYRLKIEGSDKYWDAIVNPFEKTDSTNAVKINFTVPEGIADGTFTTKYLIYAKDSSTSNINSTKIEVLEFMKPGGTIII